MQNSITLNSEGKKYFENGQVSEAIKAFKKALQLDPKFYEGWFNLGLVYQKLNRFTEAIDCYNKNIENYAQNPFALKNLTLCYSLIGDTQKALEIARVLNGDGDSWESYFNLGTTAQIAGEIEEGIKNYEKAIKLNPEFGLSYGQLYNLYSRICDWDKAKKLEPIINKFNLKAIKTGGMPAEFPYGNISRQQDPKMNFLLTQLKARDIENKAVTDKIQFVQDKRGMVNNKKIRIGYLSSDFHDHATVHLILGLLRSHNRNDFEIIAYSHGVHDDSIYRKKVMAAVDVFRDISGLNDKEAAVVVYKDVIDILVDLKGHTNGNRLGIMALKPAPISVTWLGFPGTTGGNFIDYIIADKIVIPKKESKFFSEKIIYLPNSYQVNNNTQEISDKKFSRKDFGLPARNAFSIADAGGPEKGFIFASFNQAYKISSETFTSWMRILKAVPGSVLWLYEKMALASENLKKEAKKAGVDPDRLIFAGNLPKEEHLARIKLADLSLDTFTYNGHTTTSDCLWAGVPVVTLKGNHFASRVSASLLTAIGLPELITHSPEEYEKLAIDLASSPKKLATIHESLILNRESCPLFDTKKFTTNLEKAYQLIWNNYLSGKNPQHIVVVDQ